MIGRAFILAGLLSAACALRNNANARIDTVTSLDVDAFLGRWYQMYGSISSTLLTFGNAGPRDLCTSADYSLNADNSTIDVLNQGIRPDGRVTKIYGQAKATEKAGQRKLTFQKFLRGDEEISPPDIEGNYWIYHLGPIQDGKYAFAVVAGPLSPKLRLSKTQLFVLARDPLSWSSTYDKEVLDWLTDSGFKWWWNKPRKTGSIGSFRWLPDAGKKLPGFTAGDGSRGEFGQTGCATVEGLTRPRDGALDARI